MMESPSDLDTQWLVTLLKQEFRGNKPSEIVKIEVESAVPKGENYTSSIFRAKIKTINASGSNKTYSMIVKFGNLSEGGEGVLNGLYPYQWEIKMYSSILRQMEALMDEFEDKRDTLWAKMYGFKPYCTMVLEDLNPRNFVSIDRTAWQSLDYGLLVLRNMGRFHAMSKILLKRGLIGDEYKGNYFLGKNSPFKNSIINGSVHMLSQAMIEQDGHWLPEWEDLGKRMAKQKNLLCDTLEALCHNYDQRFEVMNHGDPWTSNVLFKEMEYTGFPTQVAFVDFQFSHVNSFMWDVTYFLYTSIKPSVRRTSKDQLLTAYQESLSDNLKFFKWQDYIPTLDDVLNEANRLLPAGFAFSISILPITSGSVNNSFAMDKLVTHTPEEIFNKYIFCEEKFVREVGVDLKNFAKLKIF